MSARILLVEDEQNLSNIISLNLQMEGYDVVSAVDGIQALHLFKQHQQQLGLVLLDVMLPGINGFELCLNFKSLAPQIPVIFITAKNQNTEKITGLKLGADDYLVKPFELEELLLRIQNVLKRNPLPTPPATLKFGKAEVNFDTYNTTDIYGQTLSLSKREIALLKLLSSNANKVISRDQILEALWDKSENASARTIDNYILGFRKYFEENPKEPTHFLSIRGVGYKFQF
jgi:two-component system alkaline phosphatase synthesis response regulator PhoP